MADAVVFMNPVPSKAPQISAFKFLKVISDSFDKVSIVSSNLDDTEDAEVVNIKYKKQKNKLLRILNFFFYQLKLFFKSMSVVKRSDTVFFWVGDKMFAPMLSCKLKGAKTYFFLYGLTSLENTSKKAKNTAKAQEFLAKCSDYICCESPSVLADRKMSLTDNVRIIHLFVDTEKPPKKKQNRIGMLCRLSSGKCVLESIKGFFEFHKTHPEYTLDIVGDGILKDECESLINELNAQDCIKMYGWLSHDKVYEMIPDWKLLLFATKTEGLPNSVLECMSMSTAALCSFVGGLKDIIKDGENGFVLKGDDAKAISASLNEVIDTKDIEKVSENAYKYIVNNFTLQKARDNFKNQLKL